MLHVGAHYGASSIFARLLGGRTRRAGAFFWTWGGAPHGEEEFWSFEVAIERGWLPPVRMWGSPPKIDETLCLETREGAGLCGDQQEDVYEEIRSREIGPIRSSRDPSGEPASAEARGGPSTRATRGEKTRLVLVPHREDRPG